MSKKEYQPLILPRLQWDKKNLSKTYGELVAQPMEQGFGITLGNALRRALLAAIEGSAVTSVIIKGVNNEFSSLPGVIEDVMQILLNIKQIVIFNKTGEAGKMHLKVSGDKHEKVTVADIQSDDHLELVNKDHVIGHLSEDGILILPFLLSQVVGTSLLSGRWVQRYKQTIVSILMQCFLRFHVCILM